MSNSASPKGHDRRLESFLQNHLLAKLINTFFFKNASSEESFFPFPLRREIGIGKPHFKFLKWKKTQKTPLVSFPLYHTGWWRPHRNKKEKRHGLCDLVNNEETFKPPFSLSRPQERIGDIACSLALSNYNRNPNKQRGGTNSEWFSYLRDALLSSIGNKEWYLPLLELVADKVRLTNLLVVFATAAVMRLAVWAGFFTGVVTFLLASPPSESEKIPLESVPVEVTIVSSFFCLAGAGVLLPNQWGFDAVSVLLFLIPAFDALLRSFLVIRWWGAGALVSVAFLDGAAAISLFLIRCCGLPAVVGRIVLLAGLTADEAPVRLLLTTLVRGGTDATARLRLDIFHTFLFLLVLFLSPPSMKPTRTNNPSHAIQFSLTQSTTTDDEHFLFVYLIGNQLTRCP